MTNADKIRSMTNEELYDFLVNIREEGELPIHGYCEEGACPMYAICQQASGCIDNNPHSDINWWLTKEAD